jgi:heme/copper-type cytochrome/quinol oxidase subunit 3
LRSYPTSPCIDEPLVGAAAEAAGAAGQAVPNALIAVLILIGAEVMFFAGLIMAFMILRAGSFAWPPPGQPRLPIAITGINTLVLLASGWAVHRALESSRQRRQEMISRWIGTAILLGLTFLMIQSVEWIRLLAFGLRASRSVYGATFYTAIGAHAVHVAGGLIALAFAFYSSVTRDFDARTHQRLEACAFFWFFVVAVWPVLYVFLYLT